MALRRRTQGPSTPSVYGKLSPLPAYGGRSRGGAINPISSKHHRFPLDVIRYAVWLYFRFTLSIRDAEELLAQRGIEASFEAVRCWVIRFGPLIAANPRRRRSPPSGLWHLDEMVVRIRGRRMYLWRAADRRT